MELRFGTSRLILKEPKVFAYYSHKIVKDRPLQVAVSWESILHGLSPPTSVSDMVPRRIEVRLQVL